LVKECLQTLGLFDEAKPPAKMYDCAIVLGANSPAVINRLDCLNNEIATQTIECRTIHLLGTADYEMNGKVMSEFPMMPQKFHGIINDKHHGHVENII
jgi:hypothetical protein